MLLGQSTLCAFPYGFSAVLYKNSGVFSRLYSFVYDAMYDTLILNSFFSCMKLAHVRRIKKFSASV